MFIIMEEDGPEVSETLDSCVLKAPTRTREHGDINLCPVSSAFLPSVSKMDYQTSAGVSIWVASLCGNCTEWTAKGLLLACLPE